VYGETWGTDGYGVWGAGYGEDGAGVYATANGTPSYTTCPADATYCAAGVVAKGYNGNYGLYAYGEEDIAVVGATSQAGSYSAYFKNLNGTAYAGLAVDGFTYLNGDLLVAGDILPLAINAGSVPLERGDVVVVVGVEAPLLGDKPVLRVQKASPETASGIVGVVDVLYEDYGKTDEELAQGQVAGRFNHEVTTIQPGQYLGVVTEGVFQWLKVDATSAPIHAGDLLSLSVTPGVAAKAQQITIDGYSFYAPGTIIGKALQDLESGTGVIAVFVSLK
jgi:hypothetical protein